MKTSFPKDKIEVVLLEGIHPGAAARFEEEGFRVRAEAGSLGEDELREAVRRAHVLGIRSKTQVTAGVLAGAERLLAVGAFCIGVNQIDLDAAAGRAVPVFNAPFSNTRSVAELTVAEAIALSRRAFERSMAMHAGRWVKSAAGSHEVRGKVMGIVGYGHIGAQVSVLAEGLGMRVRYFDIAQRLPLGNAEPAGSLAELLRVSDVVTLHVPETAETVNLIGAEEIRLMKPGAHLINNARGSVVDIGALAAAIREGRLGGAAIDVFPEEPKGREAEFDGPLVGLGNVILTPHVGGSTQEAQEMIGREVSGTLIKFVNNGSTAGSVNVPGVDLPAQSAVRFGDGHAHRILNFHRNVPGVLTKINTAISELGVNVASQRLETKGELGYVTLDVAPSDGAALEAAMGAIDESIRTRVLW